MDIGLITGNISCTHQSSCTLQDQNSYTALAAQLASMTTLPQNLATGQGGQLVNEVSEVVLPVQCVCCGGEHTYDCCPHNCESVNYVQNRSNANGNTYNASWRQHPNLSYNIPCLNPPTLKQQGNSNFQNNQGYSNFQNNQGNSNFQNNQGNSNFQNNQGNSNYQHHQGISQYRQGNNSQNQQGLQNNQPSFQNKPSSQADSSPSLEEMMKGFMTQTQALLAQQHSQNQALLNQHTSQTQSTIKQQNAIIRSLETQVSQLALNQRNRPLALYLVTRKFLEHQEKNM